MKATRPKRMGKGWEAADIGKIVVNALAERKSKERDCPRSRKAWAIRGIGTGVGKTSHSLGTAPLTTH